MGGQAAGRAGKAGLNRCSVMIMTPHGETVSIPQQGVPSRPPRGVRCVAAVVEGHAARWVLSDQAGEIAGFSHHLGGVHCSLPGYITTPAVLMRLPTD